MAMQELIYATAAMLATVAAIWKAGPANESRKWDQQNKIILKVWSFAILVSIVGLISTDDFYLSISELIRINNFVWLLSYSLVAIAVYLIVNATYILQMRQEPLWLRYSLFVVIGVLSSLFFAGIASSPNSSDHTHANNWIELLFMDVSYSYMSVVCFVATGLFYDLGRSEKILHTRLRWFTVIASPFLGGLFFTIRFVYLPLDYFGVPGIVDNETLISIVRFIFAAATVIWPLFFLPTSVFQWLAYPITYFDKMLTLRYLSVLQRKIDQICPRIVLDSEHWSKQLLSLDSHIYRTVIGILDGKRTLNSYLYFAASEQLDADGTDPDSFAQLFLHNSRSAIQGDDLVSMAYTLYALLSTVKDDAEYDELVGQYKLAGKKSLKI